MSKLKTSTRKKQKQEQKREKQITKSKTKTKTPSNANSSSSASSSASAQKLRDLFASTDFRPHQVTGYCALSKSLNTRGYALLADRPGSGKTVTALATCLAEDKKTVWVFAPKSAMHVWKRDGTQVLGIPETQLQEFTQVGKGYKNVSNCLVSVFSHGAAARLVEGLQKNLAARPDVIIVDEVQCARNDKSNTFAHFGALINLISSLDKNNSWVIGVSASPMYNSVREFAAVCSLLSTDGGFVREALVRRSVVDDDESNALVVTEEVTLYRDEAAIYREQLAAESSDDTTALDDESTEEGEIINESLFTQGKSIASRTKKVGATLLTIGRFTTHAWTANMAESKVAIDALDASTVPTSAKLDKALQLVDEALERKELRICVTARNINFLKLATTLINKKYAANKKLIVDFLSGSNTKEERETVVSRFQRCTKRPHVLLFSAAFEQGISLTAATTVVLVDSSSHYSPEHETQLVARFKRSGLKHKCVLHRLVAKGTCDVIIPETFHIRKRALITQVLATDDVDGTSKTQSTQTQNITTPDMLKLAESQTAVASQRTIQLMRSQIVPTQPRNDCHDSTNNHKSKVGDTVNKKSSIHGGANAVNKKRKGPKGIAGIEQRLKQMKKERQTKQMQAFTI